MTFLPQEVIRAKRDGRSLHRADIDRFVSGLVDGSVGEGQAAAFAMAVLCRGMSREECAALTSAMTRSGRVLAWDLPGPALDKHSTGGVGDTVSLPLASIVAACGGFVPMISGRGLGHTGGTLDKLDAIPGYRSQPEVDEFRRTVREVGCAIIGQTPDLAPADRKLYAIRDVTGTVESVDLITASILSKKLAAGLDGLVMDVKFGSGAFMAADADARALAARIVEVANAADLPCEALLTDMDQPLGSAAGNAVEVAYAVEYLTGARREPRFHAVTVALSARMLILGGLASEESSALKAVEAALGSGAAAERFGRMIKALGGPADLLERPERYLAPAEIIRPVHPARAGVIAAIDTRTLGLAVVRLGGGRTAQGDRIDPAVGLTALAGLGEHVGPDQPLAMIHARSENDADAGAAAIVAAYTLGGDRRPARPLVLERIVVP